MPRDPQIVIGRRPPSAQVPEWAAEGTVLLTWLKQRGWLEAIAKRLLILRQGGYTGVDVLVLLLFLFTADLPGGIKGFGRQSRRSRSQLGAVGGRKRLPTPSSVSRALDAVQVDQIRGMAPWLLLEVPETRAVLNHPAAQLTDACGESFHIFHFDPTITGMRLRSLPEGDDLPPGNRRSAEMTAPGHAGRKRSDEQFSRAALQHAGSGLWLSGWLEPGNARPREDLEGVLDQVAATCSWINHPTERAILCCDGQWAGVPSLTAARSRNVSLITRCVRYECLEDPEILRRLETASWEDVEDSGPAPHRSATELGKLTLHPAKSTLRADSTPYEPVEVRVVASRFLQPGSVNHGRRIGQWQVELFAVDLDPKRWPAPEAVALYFSRFGQENRFAQDDRELGLDRTFSHHLPGQEFATLVGQLVWNLRICRGFEIDPPPSDKVPLKPRSRRVDERPLNPPPPAGSLVEPTVAAAAAGGEGAPEIQHTPGDMPPACGPMAGVEAGPIERLTSGSEVPAEHPLPLPGLVKGQSKPAENLFAIKRAVAEAELSEALSGLSWALLLERRPGWFWQPALGRISCPNGERLLLCAISEEPTGAARMSFRSDVGACVGCPLAAECFPTAEVGKYKNITVPLTNTSGQASLMKEKLKVVQRYRAGDHRKLRALNVPSRPPELRSKSPTTARPPALDEGRKGPPPPPETPRRRPSSTICPPEASIPGHHEISGHMFLPAAARKLFRETCEGVSASVRIGKSSDLRRHRLQAVSIADRQKRRLTWAMRNARTSLPAEVTVRIHLNTPGSPAALSRALGQAPSKRARNEVNA